MNINGLHPSLYFYYKQARYTITCNNGPRLDLFRGLSGRGVSSFKPNSRFAWIYNLNLNYFACFSP